MSTQKTVQETQEDDRKHVGPDNLGPPLLDTNSSLESIRFLGLTTTDAVQELVDNALDAEATEVHVDVVRMDNQTTIFISDNGTGIEAEKIAEVLTFGGRLTRKGKLPIGRFGWGLPSAVVCQTRHAELFSRTGKGDWNRGYIDLGEVREKTEGRLPAAQPVEAKELPKEALWIEGSGTLVVMRDCDKLEYKQKGRLEAHLKSTLGEVYRYYVHRSVKIVVNGDSVEVFDPLMKLNTSQLYSRVGPPKHSWNPDPIVFEDVLDPETGLPAKVTVKVAWLDAYKIYQDKDSLGVKKKLGIGQEKQGFYMVRHERQIRGGVSLHLFTKNPSLNHMRAEIAWPPILDDYFGVQTNKSRFSLDDGLRDKLRDRLEPIIAQCRDLWREYSAWRKKQKTPAGIEKAQEITARAEPTLRPNAQVATPEEKEKTARERREVIEAERKEIESDENLTPNQKKRKIQLLENRAHFKGPFEWVLEAHDSGDFYALHPAGDIAEIRLNTAHPFYYMVMERAIEGGFDTPLKLLLAALAKAELIYYDRPQTREFYRSQRREWSTILDTYLRKLEELGEHETDNGEED